MECSNTNIVLLMHPILTPGEGGGGAYGGFLELGKTPGSKDFWGDLGHKTLNS